MRKNNKTLLIDPKLFIGIKSRIENIGISFVKRIIHVDSRITNNKCEIGSEYRISPSWRRESISNVLSSTNSINRRVIMINGIINSKSETRVSNLISFGTSSGASNWEC